MDPADLTFVTSEAMLEELERRMTTFVWAWEIDRTKDAGSISYGNKGSAIAGLGLLRRLEFHIHREIDEANQE